MKIDISNLIGSLVDATVKSLNEKKVPDDTTVKYTSSGGNKAEMPYSSAIRQKADSPAKKAALKLKAKYDDDKQQQTSTDDETAKQKDTDYAADDEVSGSDAVSALGDEPSKTDTDGKRIISGKDKTLKKIDTLDTEDFKRDIEPDQEKFDKKNKKFAVPEPPPPYKLPDSISNNAKFPKKYVAALERMVNTKNSGDAQKWSHYSDLAGGAGQISAQAGELMAMMGSAMNDEEFNDFANSINSHVDEQVKNNKDLKADGKRVVTKSLH